MSVRRLLTEMDSEELSEWMVMDRDYHILPDTYWQTALIAHTVAECCRPLKHGSYKFEIFMPRRRPRPESAEQRLATMTSLVAMQKQKRS